MDTSVAAGIAILVLYGLADFFTAVALRHEKTVKVLVFGSITSLFVTLPVLYYFFSAIKFDAATLVVSVVAGVIGGLSLFFFFEGIRTDRISLVSPLANAWPILTVPFAIVALSERLSPLEIFGAALIVCGVMALSLKIEKLRGIRLRRLTNGLKYGLATLIGWGLMYFLVGAISKETIWVFAPFVVIAVQTLMFSAYFLYKKERVHVSRSAALPIVAQALFNTAGFFLFGFGSEFGNVAILSPLAAASPLLVIVLAYLFLKERISINEKVGIVLLIIGAVLLSF